jgi:hypothetical protein
VKPRLERQTCAFKSHVTAHNGRSVPFFQFSTIKEFEMTQPANSANTRAPYVPPKLEVLPKFNVVIGCSVAGGCIPINLSPADADLERK